MSDRPLFPEHDKTLGIDSMAPVRQGGSHAFARQLLELPDCPLVLTKPAGGPYTQDFHVDRSPWHAEVLGQIRVMISDELPCAARAGS